MQTFERSSGAKFGSAVIAVACLSGASVAMAEMADAALVNSKNLRWAAAPPTLPKGAKVAVLYGNPLAKGPYVMRFMLPSRYKIPFHWHSQTEQVTVLSGALYVVNNESADNKYAHAVKSGGFLFLPAQAHQLAYTKGATVVEIHGEGPFDVQYVNPNDDPEKWAQSKRYYFPAQYESNELNAPDSGEPIPAF